MHEREDISSDEEELESPEGTSSSGYVRERGPPSRPFATRGKPRPRECLALSWQEVLTKHRLTLDQPKRRETVPASTSQALPPSHLVMSGGPQPGVDLSRRYRACIMLV